MKSLKKNRIIGIVLAATMFLAACDQNSNPIGLEQETNIDLAYKLDSDKGENKKITFSNKIRAQKDFCYNPKLSGYDGGTIKIHKGSNFHVFDESFTPPKNINWGETVTITMAINHNTVKNELIFTFGPSGSQFSPPARIKLDYSLIARGKDVPNLYYIDGAGGYNKQEPDKVNKGKKYMYLYVAHFSRYAVAYGN